MTTTTPDFQFIDHGSIWLLFPRTPAANDLLRSDAFDGAQVWYAAEIAFRDEAELLFGHDYVVAGQ